MTAKCVEIQARFIRAGRISRYAGNGARNSIYGVGYHLLLPNRLFLRHRLTKRPRWPRVNRPWSIHHFGQSGAGLTNVGFDHHIDRTTCHDEMLHIVAANEHEAAATIDIGLIDDIKALFWFWAKQGPSESPSRGTSCQIAAHE